MIKSVRPDAQFLFANLKLLRLEFDVNLHPPMQDIASMIDQFEQTNVNNHKIDSIEIKMSCLEQKSKDLGFLANHQVRKLNLAEEKFTLKKLRSMRNNLNFLTELDMSNCRFNQLDYTAFEFFAPTLVKLKLGLDWLAATVLKKGIFRPLVNLESLVLTEYKQKKVDFDSKFVAGVDKLKSLTLTNCKFRSLRNEGFASLANLNQ